MSNQNVSLKCLFKMSQEEPKERIPSLTCPHPMLCADGGVWSDAADLQPCPVQPAVGCYALPMHYERELNESLQVINGGLLQTVTPGHILVPLCHPAQFMHKT